MSPPAVITQIDFTGYPTAQPIWTDVSAYPTSIDINRGRQHELDRDEAGTARIRFRNKDRRFDPTHTAGPYYPNILPMRRIRIGTEDPNSELPYLKLGTSRNDFAFLAATGPLAISGDFEIIIKLSLNDWTPSTTRGLVSKRDISGAFRLDWALQITTGGEMQIKFSPIGTVPFFTLTSAPLGLTDGQTKWLRVTFDENNGSGDSEADFYVSDTGVSWTHISSDSAASFGVGNTADYLVLGLSEDTDGLDGQIFEVRILSGIGGTTVADPVFSDGATWWCGDRAGFDGQGNIWTLSGGASIGAGNRYRFRGYIINWKQKWPKKRNAFVDCACIDLFHVLTLVKLTQSFSSASSEQFVSAILTAIGLALGDRKIGQGASQIIAETVEDMSALELLQLVAQTENGRLFANAAGCLEFQGRHQRIKAPYTESQAHFGDGAGELPYSDLTLTLGEARLFNQILISIRGDSTYYEASDGTSQARYFRRTLTRSNYLIDSTSEALAAARFLLGRFKDPGIRVEEMVIDGQRDPATLWPVLLSAELGDRITVSRRPPGGGDPITQQCFVEGVRDEIRPGRWIITWRLSPAANDTYGILDSPTLGKLNSTMRLVY